METFRPSSIRPCQSLRTITCPAAPARPASFFARAAQAWLRRRPPRARAGASGIGHECRADWPAASFHAAFGIIDPALDLRGTEIKGATGFGDRGLALNDLDDQRSFTLRGPTLIPSSIVILMAMLLHYSPSRKSVGRCNHIDPPWHIDTVGGGSYIIRALSMLQ